MTEYLYIHFGAIVAVLYAETADDAIRLAKEKGLSGGIIAVVVGRQSQTAVDKSLEGIPSYSVYDEE